MELVKTQNLLQSELEEAKNKEEIILNEVSISQQQILNLEIEISDYKKQFFTMQEEFSLLYSHIEYENLMGDPIPGIFSLIN